MNGRIKPSATKQERSRNKLRYKRRLWKDMDKAYERAEVEKAARRAEAEDKKAAKVVVGQIMRAVLGRLTWWDDNNV